MTLSFEFSSEIQREGSDIPFDLEELENYSNRTRDPKELVKAALDLVPILSHGDCIMGNNEWKELGAPSVLEMLDRSVTKFGWWGLQWMTHPIADRNELMRRQRIIRLLVENGGLFDRVEKLLQNIAQGEDALLAYWNKYDVLHHNVKKNYYNFFGKYSKLIDANLNQNRLALEASALLGIGREVSSLSLTLGINGIIGEFIENVLDETPDNPISFDLRRALKAGLLEPLRIHQLAPVIFINGYDSSKKKAAKIHMGAGTAGDWYEYLRQGRGDIFSKTLSRIITGMIVIWKDYGHFASIRDSFLKMRTTFKAISLLQEACTQVGLCFKAVLEYKELMGDYQEFKGGLLGKRIYDLNDNINVLLCLLNTSTFKHKAMTPFYSRGRVLLAHRLLRKYRREIIPILQAVAELDTFYSIAKLYKEHQNMPAKFCFAEFVEDEVATVRLENFWEPLISANQAVFNSVDWGAQTQNKIVITGPNGGGKSTVMKAIAWSAVLAQSWAIVPADKAQLSWFVGIRTSLNPEEDLQHGLSTFMAEKQRMDSIRSFLAGAHLSKDCSLVLLDEPYRGTVEFEAARRVCSFGKDVASMPHCMMLMATHLEKPTMLAQETNGIYKNYHLGLVENDDGGFDRTFKLLEGPADWWFHDDEKRSRFINQLIQTNARNIVI